MLNAPRPLPIVDALNLSRLDERMLSVALAHVGELGKWERGKQRSLLVEVTGFALTGRKSRA